MLSDRIHHYEETGKSIRKTPAQYKTEFTWLKEVDSLTLANVARNLETAFKRFFTMPSAGYPKFKSRHHSKKSYTTNCINGNIRLEGNYIRIPKAGMVKLKAHRPIPTAYQLKSATISKSGDMYYVPLLFSYDSQVRKRKIQSVLGLDYAMHDLYVDDHGRKAGYPGYYRKMEASIKKAQRRLSHMVKGSNNYKKQRMHLFRLYAKTACQRKDFLHKQSYQLSETYDAICVESLNMQAMSKCLHFGKSVHDNGWGMFLSFLSYKLEDRGKRLIKVDTFFPSSQLCSNCGYQNHGTKDLSLREWVCPSCGIHHDRDTNAAKNIRKEGMRLLAVE